MERAAPPAAAAAAGGLFALQQQARRRGESARPARAGRSEHHRRAGGRDQNSWTVRVESTYRDSEFRAAGLAFKFTLPMKYWPSRLPEGELEAWESCGKLLVSISASECQIEIEIRL